MNIRLLENKDSPSLEQYLAPHIAECMFMCSNLKTAGMQYTGADFEGEYYGCFSRHEGHSAPIIGVIVHYWNGNIMVHAADCEVCDHLVLHLKQHMTRSVAGILGPNFQAEKVIQKLGLSECMFSLNSNEGLYSLCLDALQDVQLPNNKMVISAQECSHLTLIQWMKDYNIEALGALDDENLEKQVQEHWNLRLQKNDSWVLLLEGNPVALSAFNARLLDRIQVGPVWTPPEHRNKGFARLLLAYTLHQEKLKGTKQAILFTDNPAAIKAYLAIGFRKIGHYRLALLKKPINLSMPTESCPI